MEGYESLNTDQILARMRDYAKDAREGTNVRHSERNRPDGHRSIHIARTA